jgi:UDP-N-acetylglucosamine:LPS N-acetylglucosamine transferase
MCLRTPQKEDNLQVLTDSTTCLITPQKEDNLQVLTDCVSQHHKQRQHLSHNLFRVQHPKKITCQAMSLKEDLKFQLFYLLNCVSLRS